MDITIHYTLEGSSLRFYFKVMDAQMFGGEGSVGYCSNEREVAETGTPSDIDILAHYAVQSFFTTNALGIERSQLVSVTKEEYDASDKEDYAYEDL